MLGLYYVECVKPTHSGNMERVLAESKVFANKSSALVFAAKGRKDRRSVAHKYVYTVYDISLSSIIE